MILPDRQIRERAVTEGLISPYNESQLQPASYDIRLGLDIWVPDLQEGRTISKEVFNLYKSEFILGTSIERVKIPNDLVARIEGKSSLARIGLLIHLTAGFIDPGFEGTITLEMMNTSSIPVKLVPGMRIAQLSFMQLAEPCQTPYGHDQLDSHYQGQNGATPSYLERFRERQARSTADIQ